MTDTPPQQSDPDHLIRFCRELLPEILVEDRYLTCSPPRAADRLP